LKIPGGYRLRGFCFAAGSGERLREALGYHQMKSTMLEIKQIKNPSGHQIEFTGRGFGHGSGLCQWGARTLAAQGKSYREILQHYYPLLASKIPE
jgi:stage II sporulation protein D